MNELRSEILISRLIDGEASAADWQEFSTLAGGAPELWRELAEAQRQQELLSAAVAEATSRADAITLPDLSDEGSHRHAHEIHVPIAQRLSAWVGWGLAAALAIALWSGIRPNANTSDSPGVGHQANIGGAISDMASSDILEEYLKRGKDEGNVLGELPDKVLVESRPSANGQGYEVLFIRPILERTSVPELYEFSAQDEAGRPVLAKYTGGARRPL